MYGAITLLLICTIQEQRSVIRFLSFNDVSGLVELKLLENYLTNMEKNVYQNRV